MELENINEIWDIFESETTKLRKIVKLKAVQVVFLFCYMGIFKKPQDINCNGCGEPYSFRDLKASKTWRCSNRACGKQTGVRIGSMFEGCKLSLMSILKLMISYVNEISYTQLSNMKEVSFKTARKFYKKFDSILFQQLVVKAPKLGGPGKVINIIKIWIQIYFFLIR
jgi:hypothetical protein